MELGKFGFVSGVVPSVFESYAAIRHPAWLHTCTKDNLHAFHGGLEPGLPIKWEVATQSELPICIGATQYRKLGDDGWVKDPLPDGGICVRIRIGDKWISGPIEGVLDAACTRALLPLLEHETSDLEKCWFGIWSGFDFKSVKASGAPLFSTPHRSWYLFQGPLGSIDETFEDSLRVSSIYKPFDDSRIFHTPANFVWPVDRSWCLAADIDVEVSYLGGSSRLISSVLAEPKLDAVEINPNERVSWLTDFLKPVIEKPDDMRLTTGFESRTDGFF